MRWIRFAAAICCLIVFGVETKAQSCIPTGIDGAVYNFACNQVCSDIIFQIPHIKGTSDYTVSSIPYTPYPYNVAGSNELTSIYVDDTYSPVISMPFNFCFYDAVYNQCVAGSNGLLTFDPANANCGNSYNQTFPIPYVSFNICSNGAPYYPQASIMGIFTDLYPVAAASPPDRKIAWHIEGTAPCRKFVLNYYHVGMFGNGNYSLGGANCNSQNPTTFQIVLYESTGLIDVNIERKQCNATAGTGYNAILGIQDWTRTKGQAAPGKNATIWNEINTAYRFTPSGAGSRFVSAELLDAGGNVVAIADTITTVAGLLDLRFLNFCPPAGNNQYVVRTTFSACENPANLLVSLDNITINRTNSLNATFATTNTNCGPPNGSITVTVPAGVGTAPYTFILDGGAPQTGPSPYVFNNVAQGAHTVLVTDASGGCSSTLNPNVGITTVLTANSSFTGTSCTGAANGTITITSANGTGPYSFVLDGGGPQTGPLPFTFTNLTAGTHTVVVNDLSNGCVSGVISIDIPAGPPFITTVNKTDVLCNGAATGTITVTQPAMGTPVYEYSLDGINWQTNNVFTGLPANTYTVYYREGAGCQGSQQITIGEPPVLSALAAATPVVCNGQNNGVITVTANGGVVPYQYSIDGGATWQASNIFNVAANNYTVTIRDANGCITTQPIVVTEPTALTASSNNSNATCNGGNDGVITVTAAGGNSGYQYSIDGVNFQSSNIFNVAPGNYTVTVKDSKGCTTTFPAVVLLTNDLTFTPQADPTICEGKSVQLNFVSNGISYAWTPATALSSTSIPNPVANPTVTTQYIVTTTFGRCAANDTVIVNVNAAPVPNAGADGFICYGQTYTLQASGGTQYVWSPSDYLSNPQMANPVSSAPRDMIYTLSIISDVNGCASLTTDDMRLDVTPPIKINTFPFDTIAYTGDIIQFLAVPSDTDVINFSWIPSIGMNNPAIPNPRVTAGAVGEDILYQVIGTTIAGCKGEGYIRLRVYKGPDIYVPTGFTPNGDGRNDRFTPFPVGIKSLKYFRVFNRWGQLVFTTNRLHEGWDGRINGVVQPTGTYVWMAEAITNENKVITKKGTVTLIH